MLACVSFISSREARGGGPHNRLANVGSRRRALNLPRHLRRPRRSGDAEKAKGRTLLAELEWGS